MGTRGGGIGLGHLGTAGGRREREREVRPRTLALRVRDARIEPEAGGGAEARAGDEDAAVLERPDPLAALLVGGGEQLLE